MAGYTRNDTSNNIADGNIINASDLDGEFDAIQTAFGTSGHTHDGTAGNGPQIGNGGIANLAVTDGKIANNTITGSKINTATTITAASFVGPLTGNASTASKLQTARNIALTGAVTGSVNFDGSGNVSIATTHTADPTVTLTGAVTGSGTMTNLGSVSIATTATADPTLTLAGDVTGSATFTNLGNATLTATVANDSHTHDGRYYTESEADTRFLRGNTSDTMYGNLIVDNGASTYLTVYGDNTGEAVIRAMGGDQGTGRVYVGQSNTYGGGIEYNGDNSPSTTGAGADKITLWRRENGTDYWTARNAYNDNHWEFRGNLYANTNQRVFADDYHPNADKWTTARQNTVTLTGDVTGTGNASVDGSGDWTVSLTTTVANDSHNHDHSDGNFTVNGDLITDEIRARTNQDLTITAGESYTIMTDGTYNDEYIRLGSENGVKVYSSTDNLTSGLNRSTTLIDTNGDMSVYRDINIGGELNLTNTTNNYIDFAGPALYIRSSSSSPTYESGIKINRDGSASLYHNNTNRIETTSSGVNVTGTVYADGLDMEDNQKILLGTSDDLRIYHDGSNSYIYNDTGPLLIDGNDIQLRSSLGERMVYGVANGAVNLYYNNSKKLATTNTGVDVTGALTVNGAPLEAGAKDGTFWENNTTISSSYTITSGKNAGTFGPVTIADGVTVTVPDGSTWTIV